MPRYGVSSGVKEAFSILSSRHSYSSFVQAISEALAAQGHLGRNDLLAIQQSNNVVRLTDYKDELLDILLDYINLALDDHILTSEEVNIVLYLKRLFAIKEGDFYHIRYQYVKEILHRQFERIYQDDDKINAEEAMHKVALQDVFDLSYDQFLAFTEHEVRLALDRGADIKDLDRVRIPKR